MSDFQKEYNLVRENGVGFYEQRPGLIEVSGGEAVQFLNGLVTVDVGKMSDASWLPTAFPNAQGRLLALARVLRFGFPDTENEFFKVDKFIFELEAATREKILQNLSRFTMAGDFHVRDLTADYTCVSLHGNDLKKSSDQQRTVEIAADIDEERAFWINGWRGQCRDFFVPTDKRGDFIDQWKSRGAVGISDETREVLRIENGQPLYGVDVDETTIVPEIDVPDLISYNKGCYIGQEIIARIHFRGHVAKRLTGLVLAEPIDADDLKNAEIKSIDGKNAGRVTSATFSPKLGKTIALAFVRYDFLAAGTGLKIDDLTAKVTNLPFVE